MSVLIKGMEMPKNGYECPLCLDGMCRVPNPDSDGICLLFGPGDENRPSDCPLVEVPPHGELIDADALKETLDYYIREAGWGAEINKALGWVRDEFIGSEPTIIPAEEDEE